METPTSFPEPLCEALLLYSARSPQKAALVTSARTVSWQMLDALVTAGARTLMQMGVQRGSRIGFLMNEPIAFIVGLLSAIRCGATIVPLPGRLSRAATDTLIGKSRIQLLVSDVPTSSHVSVASLSSGILFDSVGDAQGRQKADIAANPLAAADDFAVFYSSGTTNAPKGVVRRRLEHASSLSVLSQHNRLHACTTSLVGTALYTVMTLGTVFSTLVVGGTCLFSDQSTPEEFVELTARHRPTFCQLVPTMWTTYLASGLVTKAVLSSYERIVIGGSRLPAADKIRAIELLSGRFSEIYGTSESGGVSDFRGDAPSDKLGSVGLPLPDVRLAVVGSADKALPHNAVGEIVVRTSRLMTSYDDDNAAEPWWVEPASGERYYRTGDIGNTDRDGYLWLRDRKVDVLRSAGLNVYPSDIESVLLQHPDVIEAAVVGRANEVLGEVPVGFVVFRRFARTTTGELCRWANCRLSDKQRLLEVHALEAFPKGTAGKVLKRDLPETGLSDRARQERGDG
jgi:acyl-CoA synthetase (AMP-forming)/AMP-acid ligase II